QKTRPLGRTARRDVAQIFPFYWIEAVDLVPDFEDALPGIRIDAELTQHGIDVALLRVGVFMGDVADVENDVRLQHLLQRRTKGRNELRRQVRDESDGIGEHRLAAMRQAERSQGWIEGCK